MRLCFLLTVFSILVAAPVLAEEDASKKDAAKVQGLWEVIALEAGGNQAPEKSLKKKRFLIKVDKISLTGKPDGLRTYRLDATTKPKEIDISGSTENEFAKAIYEIDGDTLKLCFSQSTELDRPRDFDTEGTRYLCFTLKRVEP